MMWGSFGWGTLAASSLVVGAGIAMLFHVSHRWIGLIMGFGAGVLISAVAFDLVEEASTATSSNWPIFLGIFAGCGVFYVGDLLIERMGGQHRKNPAGDEDGSALAIVLGTVLDGVPESMVIGLTIYAGGEVAMAYLAAVLLSNLPEAISSTSGLLVGGWNKGRILVMWSAIAVISGLASMAGYGLFQNSSPNTVAFVLTFAAGAILTMLADTMMPHAYAFGGNLVGVVTTLGFATALLIHAFE
ncbi:MAG: ZIP family zinc transporter [Actinobacteria bacterium]|nr:ZIP family zinc transporter [Actinomycetota bacterium]